MKKYNKNLNDSKEDINEQMETLAYLEITSNQKE